MVDKVGQKKLAAGDLRLLVEIKEHGKGNAVHPEKAWCWPVKDVLEDKNFYLRLVMQYGGQHHLEVANKHFTKADFIEAIEKAPPGFFLVFGLA